MDEFNEVMNNGNLTEEQITLCRNTRRRGKNKVQITARFYSPWDKSGLNTGLY